MSALLLGKEFSNADTDTSNEARNLNKFYDIALQSTLQDLDLDSLSQPITLELIETLPDDHIWTYAYKYPSNCAYLRRLESGAVTDTKSTHIAKRVGLHEGQKVIFTDEVQAVAECIPKDAPLEAFSPMAALAVAYKLAFLSAPLIVGKGAKSLRKEIQNDYVISKAEAQETDKMENFNYEADWVRSEYVEARLS